MRVVIIGAGEVGFHVAKSLSELDYDIAVIDTDPVKCQRANEHLDVIVIEGNGSDAQVLKNANVDDGSCEYMPGDLNDDDIINILDVILLVNIILGNEIPMDSADINNNI